METWIQETWRHGDMEMEIWKLGYIDMETWKHVRLITKN
jgi:hypothetical protein